MRLATALAAVVFVLAFAMSAAGDIPPFMSYQGVLRDAAGVPVADSTYDITFRLYDVETGGTALWTETQTLPVEGGILNAHLGVVVPLSTLDFMVPYWLGIEIEGEGELAPRTALATVPYAGHAGFADTCLEGDQDWVIDGDDVYHGVGNVGVGVAPTHARFEVGTATGMAGDFSSAAAGDTFTLRATNARGTAGAFYSCTDPTSVPLINTAIFARGACGARAGHFYASSAEAIRAETGSTDPALSVETFNTGYSAEFAGGAGVLMDGFTMPTGAASGYVLTSDASGVGTWQASSGGDDGDWIFGGVNLIAGNEGYVGVGIMAPTAKLSVETDDPNVEALEIAHTSTPTRTVNITRSAAPSDNNDIVQIAVPMGSPDNFQFIECERGPSVAFQVQGNGDIVSSGGADLAGDLVVSGAQTYLSSDIGPVAQIAANSATIERLVSVEATDAGGTMDGYAVYGKYAQSTDYGIGGRFEGGWRGVYGSATETGGSFPHYGVYGIASGTEGVNYGVYGVANHTAGSNRGVYGSATGAVGTSNYAGYFYGDVNVTGTLTAGSKAFRIDHPLDPANKYLVHACVESDEMVNVYSGNVTLDGRGEARVQLPEWFELINTDYRYQLTAVGAPGPNLYIAERIAAGSFAIAGGEPGMEVSWQVTGVRNDAFAREHRLEVEMDKPGIEAGKYVHPEVHGMPASAGMDHEEKRLEASIPPAAPPAPRERFDPTDGQ